MNTPQPQPSSASPTAASGATSGAAAVLPLESRLALQAAARVKNPLQRAKAIANAVDRVKRAHPELFR
ncbi:hypothetical protein [Achromobacter ruhlandii]|uniref:hypothetical protein n=1 Tax=Achromobacter ruhlandii TaxID=72557 RepID=UPI0007BF33E4|nr:hypothetical protein [Achromobacter ruhlandii]